jgi:hypothetical protein
MSSGGSRNQTVTQTNEPPDYLRGHLTIGAEDALSLYTHRDRNQYYPGQTVVPFAGETEQALSGITNRAQQGSAVNQAASGLAARTLSGAPTSQYGSGQNPYASASNPFGGSSNPYLDQTFNKAANTVQNRLASQFAGSGRNIGASRAANASELNDLATNLYGGAYENERNRQLQYQSQLTGIGAQGYELERDRMANDINQQRQQQLGVLGMAPQIANQEYADLDRLAGVGAMREDLTGRQMEDAVARFDYAQSAPGIALDQYITRLQGMPGSSISTNTPIYRNQAAGGLGGAYLGQQIGSQFGRDSGGNYGGWGAALGGLLGYFGG